MPNLPVNKHEQQQEVVLPLKFLDPVIFTLKLVIPRAVISSLLLAMACCGIAFASERAITETARRMGVSQSDVRRHVANCADSQFSVNVCAHYEYVKADLDLNGEYAKLVASEEGRDVAALRNAQRAWIQMRDLNCIYESSDLEGGSLRPAVELACRRRMTRERTEWVLEMLSCTSIRGECRSKSVDRK